MSAEILVVEDDDAIRKLLVVALQRSGLIVDEAKDGAEAIARIAAQPYRLVIFDLMMPHVDGRDLVAAVEALPLPPPHPRLILTTAACDSDIATVRRAVDRVFCKPFDVLALVAAATQFVREETAPASTRQPSAEARPAA